MVAFTLQVEDEGCLLQKDGPRNLRLSELQRVWPNYQWQTSAEWKMPWNWAFAAARRLVKSGVKFVVRKILGTFELRFLRKEEQQNFTRNFTAFSMATSTQGFRRKYHGSTSARPAEMTITDHFGLTNPRCHVTGQKAECWVDMDYSKGKFGEASTCRSSDQIAHK